jgi:PTH1 family peptidyl-tRNA hydrolase
LLSPFRKVQLKVVDEMLEVAADAVKVILTEGAAAAMNRFNRKGDTENN